MDSQDKSWVNQWYVRNALSVAYAALTEFHVFQSALKQVDFRGKQSPDIARIFDFLAEPAEGRSILATVNLDEATLQKVLDSLVAAGHIIAGNQTEIQQARQKSNRSVTLKSNINVLVAMTGAVQSIYGIQYLNVLAQAFQNIEVILTEAATHFIRPYAIEVLFGRQPWIETFEVRGEIRVPHIHLARWADVVVVLPASASAISRIATASCSDLLSLTIAATRSTVIVAPSMNHDMWGSIPIQSNARKLLEFGYIVISPGYGFEVADTDTLLAQHGSVGATPTQLVDIINMIVSEKNLTRRQIPC